MNSAPASFPAGANETRVPAHADGRRFAWMRRFARGPRRTLDNCARRLLGFLHRHRARGPGHVSAATAAPFVCRGATRSLVWSGEIIAANAEDVWRMTTAHLAAFATREVTLVIVDLARLRFIDDTGASLMARLKQWGRERHVEILFAHPPEHVRHLLAASRMDDWLLEGGQ